ncbi:MAG: F0F1 ATP synthase subunit B [Planctomycetota bacterium]
MCCTSAKNLLRLILLGGLVLVGGSVQLMAAEASKAAETSDTAHAGGHAGHDTSVPLKFKDDLAFFSLIVFLLFVAVLGKFAWGPMIQGLDKREAGIQKAISDAEDNRRKSEAMLAEYDQKLKAAEQTVAAMVAEARRDAERTSQDLIANAQKEVGLIRERAKDEIRQAKDSALADVFTQINSQVVLATEHVLGRALNSDDQDRLVSQALAEISR